MDNTNKTVAEHAEQISRQAAQVSIEAAKVAARENIANVKSQAADKLDDLQGKVTDVASQAADRINSLQDAASDKLEGLTDKLKGFAADALESGAKAAHNLAGKLKD